MQRIATFLLMVLLAEVLAAPAEDRRAEGQNTELANGGGIGIGEGGRTETDNGLTSKNNEMGSGVATGRESGPAKGLSEGSGNRDEFGNGQASGLSNGIGNGQVPGLSSGNGNGQASSLSNGIGNGNGMPSEGEGNGFGNGIPNESGTRTGEGAMFGQSQN